MQRSLIGKATVGLAAGLMGGALNSAFLGLVDAGFAENATWQMIGQHVFWGGVWGIAFAFVFQMLPRPFFLRALIIAIATTAVAWTIVLPARGIEFSLAMAIQSLAANVIYGVMTAFVLRQTLELPLPPWQPPRRAEEFRDDPAGA